MLILIFTEKRSFRLTVDEALSRLQKSAFRAKFHLSDEDINYIDKKGLDTVKSHAEDFIKKRLAPAVIPNDGKQTPMRGHPVFKAQHACACCCRGCLNKWYHVEKGRELSYDEQRRIVNLLMAWIEREYRSYKIIHKSSPVKESKLHGTFSLFNYLLTKFLMTSTILSIAFTGIAS